MEQVFPQRQEAVSALKEVAGQQQLPSSRQSEEELSHGVKPVKMIPMLACRGSRGQHRAASPQANATVPPGGNGELLNLLNNIQSISKLANNFTTSTDNNTNYVAVLSNTAGNVPLIDNAINSSFTFNTNSVNPVNNNYLPTNISFHNTVPETCEILLHR